MKTPPYIQIIVGLLGRRTWWLPRAVDRRLPRIAIEAADRR